MIINYSNQDVLKGEKSIFLAGPTPRYKGIATWRLEACEYLEKIGYDGIVYIPEYSTHDPKEGYEAQADWEREAMTNAKVIVFWVARKLPDMPAFTTNVEFGYWIHTKKVLYGRPDDADKIKYLDWLYKKELNKEPFNDLETLLKAAIQFDENPKI